MHPGFALALVFTTLILTVGYVFKTLIQARWPQGGAAPDQLAASRQIELLADENAALKSKVGRLEERLANLERIATDPAERTAREIEQLR